MAAQAVEYFVLLTVAGTQPEDESENYIVLFSWAVISKSRNQVLTKEQLYVKPSQPVPAPSLPGGIKPEAVNSAATLPVIIEQFQSAVSKLGNSFMLLCPGPLPLRHYVHREAQTNGVQLDPYFYQYVDVNTEFCRGFPDTQRPTTLEDMCSFLGIEIAPSSPKLGLAELKMVADITQKLIMQGHTFGNPERIVMETEMNHSATADTSLVEEGNVVRCRGLPFQASMKDVANFLSGLNIIPGGIVFSISTVGRRNGEAIVVLETPEQSELAIKRHKFFLDTRYIEVYETTPEDFLRLTGVQDRSDIAVVRMQGLLYRANEDDIVEFFGDDAPVKEGKDGVMIVRYTDGRASGDAIVLFENRDLENAMAKNRQCMGSRYVELYRSTMQEFQMVLSRSGSQEQQHHFIDLLDLNVESSDGMSSSVDGLVRGNEKNCVKLRGLPWAAKPEDVISFFGDLGSEIAPKGIHMVLSPMNKSTGDCYVQMQSVEAASKTARLLHKKEMGHRYIEIFECTGDEVALALKEGSSGGGGGGGGGGGFRGGRGRGGYYEGRSGEGRGEGRSGEGRSGGGGSGRRQRSNSDGGAIVKVRGLPWSTKDWELAQFFQDYDVRERDCEIMCDQSGRATGIAYVTFQSRARACDAIDEKDGKYIGKRYIELSLN